MASTEFTRKTVSEINSVTSSSALFPHAGGAPVDNKNGYYIDGRIYLNLSKSVQSAAGLNALIQSLAAANHSLVCTPYSCEIACLHILSCWAPLIAHLIMLRSRACTYYSAEIPCLHILSCWDNLLAHLIMLRYLACTSYNAEIPCLHILQRWDRLIAHFMMLRSRACTSYSVEITGLHIL